MKKAMAFLVMAAFVATTAVCMAADAPAAKPAAPAATVAPAAPAATVAPAKPAAPAPVIANKVGTPVPAWEAKSADSDAMYSSEKLKGQAYGIVFVNSSCSACRSELSGIVKLNFDKFTLIVAAVDVRLDRIITIYRDQLKVAGPVIDDSKFGLAKNFGVSFTPASVIVGADGKLEAWNAGFTAENAEQVMAGFSKYAVKK